MTNPDELRRDAAHVLEPRLLSGLANDVRYSVRLLGRQRGFAAIAVLTMALATGVMTTLFSVVYGVLLKPLPWPEPDRLVRLTETHVGATRQMPLTMTNITYLPWLDKPSTIESIGAWSRSTVALTGGGETERILIAQVTPSTFTLMRGTPIVGSIFTRDDVTEVVLSRRFWQSRFAENPAALGQTIQLNGRPFTIVGVMPSDFKFPDADVNLWRPLAVPPVIDPNGTSRNISMFSAVARLKPGATPQQAAEEATARAKTGPDAGMTALAMFGTNGAAIVTAVPALDAMTADVKPGLIAVFIAVSLLLLTAVANIASLQLARAMTRLREMAIRSAIGASASRLVQQLFIENVVLAVAGGVAGLLLSAALHQWLPALLPSDFPRAGNITFSGTVSLFALAITAITAVMLGVLPALHLRRIRLVGALFDNATSVVGGARARTRLLIMTGQVAIACTLLIGAMLLTRSFVAMLSQNRGFNPDGLLTAHLSLPDYSFQPSARLVVLDDLLQRVRTLPAVQSVALTTGLPLSGSENLSAFSMPSVTPPVGTTIQVHAVRSVVTPDFVNALGLRIAQGRSFRPDEDSPSGAKVVVVNRTFARQYLSERVLGDRIRNFMRGDGVDFEVIGVVDDMMRKGLSDGVQPEIYSLLHQSSGPDAGQELMIRTSESSASLGPDLRRLMKELAPAGTIDAIRTMDERIAASLAKPRLYAALIVVFGIAALAIAAVGLFGVLSYVVAQRQREMALRSALGASPARVFALILKQGLFVTLAGVATGVAASLAFVGYLATLLYGVQARDATSFLSVAGVIVVIAIMACLAPAIRAMRIDPLTALKTS